MDKAEWLAFLGLSPSTVALISQALKSSPSSSGVAVKAPQPGSGGSTRDDSSVTFTPRAVLYVNGQVRSESKFSNFGDVEIDAGQSGQLMLFLTIHGFEDNLAKNESFTQEVQESWDVSADDNGMLSIETPQETIKAPTTGTYYRLDSVNPDKGKNFVQVSPVIISGADSGSVSVGVGVGKQAGPAKIKETFRVEIRVKIPKQADPTGTVTIGKDVTVMMKFDYTIGPFKIGSPTLLEANTVTKQVYTILHHMIPEETKNDLINGKLAGEDWLDGKKVSEGEKIEVHGYTSNTDTEDHNFKLSKQRAESVLAAFKSLGVPASAFSQPIPHGEWETSDDSGMGPTDDKRDEKESADWRKVVIKIKHPKTFSN